MGNKASLRYTLTALGLVPGVPSESSPHIANEITDRQEAAIATGQLVENSNWISVLAMVFHSMRAGDVTKQDIVSIRDILDPSTNFPSRLKLLEILKDDVFQEGQYFLIVNDRIRVTNERQFLACFQYLFDSNILNYEALVYDA